MLLLTTTTADNMNFATPPQPPQPQQQQLFGMVVSGCPVRTDFVGVDASGLKLTCRLTCPGDIPAPLANVSDIALFLLPNVALPPNHGVLCYWQLTAAAANTSPTSFMEPAAAAATGYELLGALTPDRPSQIFYTGWGEHEQLLDVAASGVAVVLTIALSIEPLDTIANLTKTVSGGSPTNLSADQRLSNRLNVAQKIGSDLFRFMQSFDTGSAAGSMVVPNNIFDRWFARFTNRFQRDPNFFLKQLDDE